MLLLSTKLCVVCLRSDASRLFHCNSCRGQMIIRTFESKLSDDDNRAPTETMDDTILFSSDWEEDRETKEEESSSREPGRGWFKLPPKVRLALIQKGQERAIANKKKREPADVKKRRVMMFFKQAQIDKKMRSKIKRPLPIRSAARIPLEQLISDKNRPLNGTVISLTTFGAYIDVLSGCDGLLHVSQMSTNGTFIENIRDVLQPGDILENCLYVRRCSPELNKLQLTMVPPRSVEQEEEEEEEEEVAKEEEVELPVEVPVQEKKEEVSTTTKVTNEEQPSFSTADKQPLEKETEFKPFLLDDIIVEQQQQQKQQRTTRRSVEKDASKMNSWASLVVAGVNLSEEPATTTTTTTAFTTKSSSSTGKKTN